MSDDSFEDVVRRLTPLVLGALVRRYGRFDSAEDAVQEAPLYLIFTEGYAATSGPDLHRAGLTSEAIRLPEVTAALLPDDGEVAGLLALMGPPWVWRCSLPWTTRAWSRTGGRTRPGHLLEVAGDLDAARTAYGRAARLATNIHHVRYLNARARGLGAEDAVEENGSTNLR